MKERRLVITIDCDDVLVPTAYKVLDHYRDEFGHEVNPAHFYESTAEDWGVHDLKHVNRRIEQYFRSKKFHHEGKISYPEATVALPALVRIHIDDHTEYCENVLDAGIESVILYGEYPWNRTVKLRQGLARCVDWVSTVKEVSRIAAS